MKTRGRTVTAKTLSRKAIGIINSVKFCSTFYRNLFDLVSKFNVGPKFILNKVMSEPEIYGDLVYRFRDCACKLAERLRLRKGPDKM